MKQLKPFKMFVPESDIEDSDIELITITRPEIHELVKAHAEKLKYDYSHISKYAKYVYLNDDGFTQYGSTDSTFNNDVHHKEIQWQDFLKFTPGDVEVGYPIEKASESFDALMEREFPNKLTPEDVNHIVEDNKMVTTDRNEKAYSQGRNMAYSEFYSLIARNSENDLLSEVSALKSERHQVISVLRSACEDFGDNDWPDNLHLVDIIDKHLIRHLQAGNK